MSTPTKIPALYFTAKGFGPDEVALVAEPIRQLRPTDRLALGLRIVRSDHEGAIVMNLAEQIDGGFYLEREQVAALHSEFGAWLDANVSPDHPAPQPPRGVETSAAIHGASVEVPTTAVDAETVAPDEPAPGQGSATDGRAVCSRCDRPLVAPGATQWSEDECLLALATEPDEWDYTCLMATIEKWRARYEHKCAQADRASAEDVRLRGEVERLTANVLHWRTARETAMQAGEILRAQVDEANAARIEAEHARDDARASRDAWKAALAEMTKARDEACDLADQVATCAMQEATKRLRAVGRTAP